MNAAVRLDTPGFGIAVGHATDAAGATGLTVIRGVDAPLRASAHVPGRATGSRELALLDPSAHNDRIDAILLTGGSAYGLDAAAGVMRWMEERGRGYAVPGGVVPIVPAAVVFDLAPLGRFDARPTAEMAYRACNDAKTSGIEEGSVGAGTGCTVGKVAGPARCMKGGLGIAVAGTAGSSGVMAAAIVAVNAVGHVRDLDGAIIAGPRGDDDTPGDAERMIAAAPPPMRTAGANTTLAVVALNVALTKVELHQLARAASAAFYRRIGPAGTSFDGDVVFAVAPMEGRGAPLLQAEVAAVAAVEEAIVRAVRLAKGRDGIPGLADSQQSI
ncbi:MAG TPA: P1 family peptidase [Gemmatimonadaceae bacterium]|nr:P1 family peptidase [Gemmatimonadaceae bacterium]